MANWWQWITVMWAGDGRAQLVQDAGSIVLILAFTATAVVMVLRSRRRRSGFEPITSGRERPR